MNMFRILAAALVLTSGLPALPLRAAEPTKDDIESAERRAAAVSELVFAAEMAAYGRGDKVAGVKSPESIVNAAGILLRLHKAFGKVEALDVKPTDAKDTAIGGDAEKTIPLDTQAAGLYEEARLMVAEKKDKAWSAALEALIERTKADAAKDVRGATGRPKTYTRKLSAGQTHKFPVDFVGGKPACIAMTSSGARLQFDIVNLGTGANLFSIKGSNAEYNWTPGAGAIRKFEIKLTIIGQGQATYTVTTN